MTPTTTWQAICEQRGCSFEPITSATADPPSNCPVCGSPFVTAPVLLLTVTAEDDSADPEGEDDTIW